jgi:hypothetical protein
MENVVAIVFFNKDSAAKPQTHGTGDAHCTEWFK